MNRYSIAFVVFLLLSLFLGPFIADSSGATSIEILAGITTFGGALLALIFGIIGVQKTNISTQKKIASIVLIVIAVLLALLVGVL